MLNNTQIKIDTAKIRDTIMNFIVPLVSFGLTAAMAFFVIYPSIQSLPKLKSDLATAQSQRASLEQKVGVLNKLTDFKSVLDEDLKLIEGVLVSEDSVPFLLNQIDRIARNTGLTLSRLNYGVGGTAEVDDSGTMGAASVAVNLGALGTYDQLISFLENMETAARFIEVSTFRYAVSDRSVSDSSALSLSFLLYSPYLDVNSKANTDDPISLDITSQEFINTLNYLKGFTFYDNSLPENPIIADIAEEKPLEEITLPDEVAPVEEVTPFEEVNVDIPAEETVPPVEEVVTPEIPEETVTPTQ